MRKVLKMSEYSGSIERDEKRSALISSTKPCCLRRSQKQAFSFRNDVSFC